MKRTILVTLLLAGCQSEPADNAAGTTNAAASEPGNTASEPARNQSEGETGQAGMRTAEVGPLRLRYDPARLAQTDAEIGIPPDWQREVRGMKLIARDRLPLLDTAECMYGLSGEATRCTAEKEAGLAFALLDRPYEQLSGRLTEPAPEPITLAGRQGIVWKIGAEGEGADYMLIPADGQTLLIVRQYRTSGEINEQAIQAVLNSLSIDAG